MSWSIDVAGTKNGVVKNVTEQLDKAAASYDGKEEAKDVVAVKERILSIVEAVDVRDEGAGEYAVYVKANGSHAWNANGILSAHFVVTIGRTTLALG